MSARMGSFTINSSLGFGLAVLGFLILKARILTKCSETTLLKAVCFCILHVIKKIECNNSMSRVTNTRPTKEFRAAREAFRRDQQLLLSFVVCFC